MQTNCGQPTNIKQMPFAARPALLLVCLCGVLASASCTVGNPTGLTIRGQADPDTGPVKLTGDFDTAYYSDADPNSVTFVLLDGDEVNPTQAAVVRLFWRPRAGRTPLEETATNCTISYLVFAPDPDADRRNPGEVGVYAGAGFLMPDRKPGPAELTADMWDASLRLDTRSDRFTDLLGSATLTGSFKARRDPAKVGTLLQQLNRAVAERLGFPRLVDAGNATPAASRNPA